MSRHMKNKLEDVLLGLGTEMTYDLADRWIVMIWLEANKIFTQ